MADPEGGPDPQRVKAALRGASGPLPGAREEAKAITRIYPDALLLEGAAAREARVKQEIGRYSLLHFATHGAMSPNNGLQSWLLLAPEPPDSREDGRLEAREILSLPLKARLAVLSACGTAQGQRSGGDGLLGLVWAFQAAGCPSVVASQWPVKDKATQALMARFYQELKAGVRRIKPFGQPCAPSTKCPASSSPSSGPPSSSSAIPPRSVNQCSASRHLSRTSPSRSAYGLGVKRKDRRACPL